MKYVTFLLLQYRDYDTTKSDDFPATSYGYIIYNTLNTRKMLGGYMHGI